MNNAAVHIRKGIIMKKNKKMNILWQGVPDQLRYLCLADFNETLDFYATKGIIDYLLDHMDDYDSFIYDITPYDVINWIDKVFVNHFYPTELHENEWISYSKEIEEILLKSEELIQKYGPSDYVTGYIIPYDKNKKIDIIGYAQRLNIYFSTLYMYTDAPQKLDNRLSKLFEDTKLNVTHMVFLNEAGNYIKQKEWSGFHISERDRIEPLLFLSQEYIPAGFPRMLYADILEEYALFLDDMLDTSKHSDIYSVLHNNAEELLIKKCDEVLDDIYDELENSNEDNEILLTQNKRYETMYNSSKERCLDSAK